jgi:RNA polymerase sigma-70 factor, ECF subfamily
VALRRPEQDTSPSEAKTLGDVLYAHEPKGPVPERDWVGLVQCIAARDQLKLRTLYAQTHRIVFTLIMRIVGNRETAEELTLDVFHDVWRRASAYDPAGGSVLGWILNQARSRAIDRFRFEHRKKRVKVLADGPATADFGRHEAFDVGEQARLLRQALQVLRPTSARPSRPPFSES